MELPQNMRHDKKVLLSYIRAYGESESESFFANLPYRLQRDVEIVVALLKTGYKSYEFIFDKLPYLFQSREAMMATAKVVYDHLSDYPEFVAKCGFRDDKEFMLAAYKSDKGSLEYASERLLSDRDFMVAASNTNISTFITYASLAFQVGNIDLVVNAIENGRADCSKNCFSKVFLIHKLDSSVWNHRPVVMAWLESGWPILELLAEMEPVGPFLNDPEVVAMSVRIRQSDLKHTSRSLRADREFILSLVKDNGSVLQFAGKEFSSDDEFLTAAVAESGRAIVDCFGVLNASADLEFICHFASRIRSKLALHESFVIGFLRGMSLCDQSHIAPSKRCQLPLLNRAPRRI